MAPTASATAAVPTLTQSGARVALEAAEQHALDVGVPMSVAVVDAHTHLLAFTRMDGAKITSINTAMDMAFTAAGNRIPTSAYQETPWSGSATSGIGNTIMGRFTTLGGGVPILSAAGDILGAIGCSTGTSMQDEAAAKAGRDAVLEVIRKEKEAEEVRLHEERQAVLALWKEKEEEVGSLREELEGMDRSSKRMRLDGGRSGSASVASSMAGRRSSTQTGLTPATPPEEAALHPSFVGEVAVGRY
ncbi:ethanolamine utilization eutt [Pyrenophora seminiperda CCB06]|uniref:Ethanolamine utilization eutt n=1 Tax=Pyrenophora seminiperda CCB06 TaxID=1302712 RepID=A0A3M7LY68_9PLEO|nr:ethanolamine utilization eutt [Pyrenophora seminiperda CCB06]